MDSVLPGLWSLSPIGAVLGMLVLAYWLLATGRLVPKATHAEAVRREQDRADEWKATSTAQAATIAEQGKQIGALIEANKINQQVFLTGKSIAETALPGGA